MTGNEFVACVGGPMNGRIIPMPMGSAIEFAVYLGWAKPHARHQYKFASKKCGGHEWLYLKYAGRAK